MKSYWARSLFMSLCGTLQCGHWPAAVAPISTISLCVNREEDWTWLCWKSLLMGSCFRMTTFRKDTLSDIKCIVVRRFINAINTFVSCQAAAVLAWGGVKALLPDAVLGHQSCLCCAAFESQVCATNALKMSEPWRIACSPKEAFPSVAMSCRIFRLEWTARTCQIATTLSHTHTHAHTLNPEERSEANVSCLEHFQIIPHSARPPGRFLKVC